MSYDTPSEVRNKPTDAVLQWPIVERPDLAARCGAAMRAVGAQVFMMNGCRIIVTREDGWHLSISRPDRDPSWQEIATARYRLLGDVEEMAMYLPPLSEYVNLHPHTFHLYEHQRSSLILAGV